MRKFTLFMMSLFLMLGTAMAQNYSLTETGISSEELNAKTAPTLIAIKNLSATNNYYFVGNTGAAPYSAAEFSDAAVFVWQPVEEGVAGSYYLMKLDGTYMQATSPKDFGTVDGAAVFTTTNPTTSGTGSTKFNGDQDSQAFIVDEALLVRFVNAAGTWINVQNGDNGTPTYNSGLGGWTIHHIYAVEEAAVEPEPEVTAGFVHSNTELTLVETTEYPEGITTAKESEATGEGCTTGVVKSAVTAVNAPAAGNVTVAFQYQSGNHKLVMLGVDVLDLDGNVVKGDYHYGFTGGNTQNNTYTIEGIDAGDYQLRYFFCHKADDHEAGNQVAQITVTGLNKREAVEPEPEPEPELGEGEVYIYHITAKDAARGALYATAESTHLTHCGATYGNYHNRDIAVNAEDINQQFVFVEYEGVQYLYSLGAQKFAVKDGQFIKLTENPEGFVTIEDADVAGYKLIKFNGQYRLNFSGGYDHGCVANYETPDDGNRLTFTKAGTYNATELVAAIEAYLNAEAEALAAARAAFDAAYADAAAILTEAALSVTENEVALQTTDENAAYYLWCNVPDPEEGSINALVDGTTTNDQFFHSSWHTSVTADMHYLEVDLGEGNELAEFVFGYHTRVFEGVNDFPDGIQVMGSNNGENYTEVANIASGLPQAGNKSWKSNIISSETAYRYFRFNVTAERTYWHMSEFDIFTSEVSVADKYVAVAKEIVALNKAYTDAANNADYDAEALTAAAEAIKACIETINAGVVEPEIPFEVVAVTPTEAVAELTTVTVEFSEEIEGTFDMMGMSQIYLGTKDNGCSFEVNGKVLTITPFNAITAPGDYKLVIPSGLITRKSNGEAVTMNGEYVFTVKEAEAPFEVVAVTPTEAVAELTTVTVEFSEEIEGTFDMMGMTQIYLGTKDNGCSFEVNGKVLTITPFNAINTPGEYKLVIPEGLITRKSNGEAVTMNGEYVFTVKEAVVEPEPETPATLNETVVFDFVNGGWDIPTMEENNFSSIKTAGEHTDGTKTINIDPTANGGSYIYDSKGFLNISKPGTKIILPAFGFAVEKIEVVGHSSGTSYPNVDMNVYVGEDAVSTACIGTAATSTFEIAAENQAAGNVYELVIGSNGGNYSSVMYITYIKVYPAENKLEAPVIDLESGVYVGAQTVNVHSATADLEGVTNVTYYYTTDGNEPTVEDEETDGEITIENSCTLKVIVELTYGDKTYVSASTSAEYIISEAVTYHRAATVESGNYFLAANGHVAAPLANGVLPGVETTIDGNDLTEAAYYAITLEETAEGGAYYIKDVNGNYIYTSSMYGTSGPKLSSNGAYIPMSSWTITVADDENSTATIVSEGLTLVYDTVAGAFKVTESVSDGMVLPTFYGTQATGVENVVINGEAIESIYDLNGRKLEKITEGGIYIVNGKKVLVK